MIKKIKKIIENITEKLSLIYDNTLILIDEIKYLKNCTQNCTQGSNNVECVDTDMFLEYKDFVDYINKHIGEHVVIFTLQKSEGKNILSSLKLKTKGKLVGFGFNINGISEDFEFNISVKKYVVLEIEGKEDPSIIVLDENNKIIALKNINLHH